MKTAMSNARSTETQEIERLVEEEVSRKLDAMVHAAVGKEEDIRFRQLKWIMVFIGLVGLGTFGTLTNYLIEKAVDGKIESSTGRISNTLEMFRMQDAAIRMELDGGLSDERTDEIMDFLRRAEDLQEIRGSNEFRGFLQQATSTFVGVDKTSAVDELFAIYEREIISSPLMVESMLHHYGQQLAVMQNNENDPTEVAFNKLSRVAEGANVPEVALLYRTLHESRNARPGMTTNVVDLIKESKSLDEMDRQLYFAGMFRFTRAGNWMRKPTRQGRSLERISREFVGNYGSDIAAIYGSSDGSRLLESMASEGVDEDEARAIAQQITSP